jgi:VIT1/CCC1 family predicted Fe2+/Mn2+ transporter
MDVGKIVREICRDEYFSHYLYKSLAKKLFISSSMRSALEKAAEDEYRHYLFWKGVAGECSSTLLKLKALFYTALFYLFGLTVLLKYLESKEKVATEVYRELTKKRPDIEDVIERIAIDEERHERAFLLGLDEGRVRYIGSITLGISDALVELTGIYTGSLGAFESTLSAGLAGFLAGIAASISMGIASYAQAKNEGRARPGLAALYTFLAYIAVALLLALPYFIISSLLAAFIVMLILAVTVVAYMAFYVAVLQNRSYLREFIEATLLIFGVSILLYTIGSVLGNVLGVKVY